MLKGLVSGFGPYSITSVTVVDGVATANLGTLARISPGVKIAIDGTGDAEVDTWHEIQKVEGNTISFNVETSDGTYTNGITLSYPSLGWTLVTRDANRSIIRNGISGSNRVYVEMAVDPDRTSTDPNQHYLRFRIVDDVKGLNQYRYWHPTENYRGFPWTANDSGGKVMWMLYGDDSYLNAGFNFPYNTATWHYLNYSTMHRVVIGDLGKTSLQRGGIIYMAPMIYINSSTKWSYKFGGTWTYGSSGFESSPNFDLITKINDKNNYSLTAYTACNLELTNPENSALFISGRPFFGNNNATKYLFSSQYNNVLITDRYRNIMGNLPGCYYISKRMTMSTSFDLRYPLKNVSCQGKLKNRFTYLIYGEDVANGYETNYFYEPTMRGNQPTVMLDLTGPIR
jgi:hypothetical protein